MKLCIPIIRQDGVLNDMVAQNFGMRTHAEKTQENNT